MKFENVSFTYSPNTAFEIHALKNINIEIPEKQVTENTVLLVGLLYNMCKVEIVLKSKNENDINSINKKEIQEFINNANAVLVDKF